MIKRKEILNKKEMLTKEIDFLINQRGSSKDDYQLNKKIEDKKRIYNFYNNLLKKM